LWVKPGKAQTEPMFPVQALVGSRLTWRGRRSPAGRRTASARLGAVVPRGVLVISLDARRYDGLAPRDLEEDVLGVVGSDVEPVRIFERSGIDAADVGEALEAEIELRAAGGAEVDEDQLAAAFRAMAVSRRRPARDSEILAAKDRLYHVG